MKFLHLSIWSPLRKILQLYRNIPIRDKMLLMLFVQVVIPVLLIGYLSFQNSATVVKNQSINYMQNILQTVDVRVNDFMESLETLSQELLYDTKIIKYLTLREKQATEYQNSTNYETGNEINNLLRKVVFSYKKVRSIGLIRNDGVIVYANKNDRIKSVISVVALHREKIEQEALLHSGKSFWMTFRNEGQTDIVFVRTIYSKDTFNEVGTLLILIDNDEMATAYSDLQTDNLSDVAIVNESGILILGNARTYLIPPDQKLLAMMTANSGVIEDHEKDTLISFRNIPAQNWHLMAFVDENTLYSGINKLRQILMTLTLFTLLIMSILSVLLSLDITRPIHALVGDMKKIQKGSKYEPSVVDRNDELGFLNRSFNEMAGEISHLVTWVYREQLTRKDAQLKALQAQINPHFLFNTLESINWMAQLNHVPEISKTVTSLSALMEAGIGRDDKLIRLIDEMSYINHYMTILKNRFEDAIVFQMDVSEEAFEAKIPRLLIQPLIENAVFHGIEQAGGSGRILLSGRIDEGLLHLSIEDTGVGMSQEVVDELNQRLAIDNDTYFKNIETDKTKRVGVENVNRRIKLLYGNDYGMRVESIPHVSTKFLMIIPFVTGEDDHVQGSGN